MKELIGEWADMQESFTDLQTQFTDLKNFVIQFFEDLDLQEYVNNTLDKMAADGTLAQLLNYNGIDIDLNNITPIQRDISLSALTEYVEATVVFNDNYYAAARDFSVSPNRTKILVYNADCTLLTSVALDADLGVANSAFCDENYIYIDCDGGKHIKLDENLNIISSWTDSIRNYGYDPNSKKYYAIEFSSADITVTEVTPLFEKLDDTAFTVTGHSGITLQSAFIHNGIIYIPTTQGYFRFIHIKNKTLSEIFYNDVLEIESFFNKENKLLCCGHYYGLDGIFSIYNFDGGVPDVIIRNIAYDGLTTRNGLVNRIGRYGIYSITNGLSADIPFPCDTGELINFKDFSYFISKTDNRKYVYDGGWVYAGTLKDEQINLTGYGYQLKLILKPDGLVYLRFMALRITGENNVVITQDFSSLYSLLGISNTTEPRNTLLSAKYGSAFRNSEIYGVYANLSPTALTIQLKNITTPSEAVANYDAYISGLIPLTV